MLMWAAVFHTKMDSQIEKEIEKGTRREQRERKEKERERKKRKEEEWEKEK